MFSQRPELIYLSIVLILYKSICGQMNNNQSLFPPPNYSFINDSKECYDRCSSKIRNTFGCEQCLESTKSPESVDSKTFCCFHYKHIDCTFDCLFESMDNTYDPNDSQYTTGYQTLSQDLNQTLARVEAIDECNAYKSREECSEPVPSVSAEPADDVSEDPEGSSGPKKTSTPVPTFKNEGDAFDTVLIITCVGSVIIGVALFTALIYLTRMERKHFNNIRGNYTTVRTDEEHTK